MHIGLTSKSISPFFLLSINKTYGFINKLILLHFFYIFLDMSGTKVIHWISFFIDYG